jgi:hypothetical protein
MDDEKVALHPLDETLVDPADSARRFGHKAATTILVTMDAVGVKYVVMGEKTDRKTGAKTLVNFGGKAENGESPTQTAGRELYEELLRFVYPELAAPQGIAVATKIVRSALAVEKNNDWQTAERLIAAGKPLAKAPYLVPTYVVALPYGLAETWVNHFNAARKDADAELSMAVYVPLNSIHDEDRATTLAQMTAERGSVTADDSTCFFAKVVQANEAWPVMAVRPHAVDAASARSLMLATSLQQWNGVPQPQPQSVDHVSELLSELQVVKAHVEADVSNC